MRLQSNLDITSKNPRSLYQKMHVKVWGKFFTKLFRKIKEERDQINDIN
jgi:hypothetical protein